MEVSRRLGASRSRIPQAQREGTRGGVQDTTQGIAPGHRAAACPITLMVQNTSLVGAAQLENL